MHRFESTVQVAVPPAEVWKWFCRPGAFERLTPPWERIEIIERTGDMELGRMLFRIRKGPVWFNWNAQISGNMAERWFEDRQLSGPFRSWVHRHLVEGYNSGSIVRDCIDYELPSVVSPSSASVRRMVERLFSFRRARMVADCTFHNEFSGGIAKTVLVAGSSGLVGRQLCHFLSGAGHRVFRIVRRPARAADEIEWNRANGSLNSSMIGNGPVHAVVNLAGAGIADERWSLERKQQILSSRVDSTNALVDALAANGLTPEVYVSASAIGIYGPGGDDWFDESSTSGSGFLADVCRQWEEAASGAGKHGSRVVTMRFGVIITAGGGALAKMLPAFRGGFGGPLGDGRQFMSWVALDDVLRAIAWSICGRDREGSYNVTAPFPVRQHEFAEALGRVIRRPAVVRTPAFAIRAMFGEMGTAMLLEGVRVRCARLQSQGFPFLFTNLDEVLRFELGRPSS